MSKDEIEPAGELSEYGKQQKNVKHQARVEEMNRAGGTEIHEQLRGKRKKK